MKRRNKREYDFFFPPSITKTFLGVKAANVRTREIVQASDIIVSLPVSETFVICNLFFFL